MKKRELSDFMTQELLYDYVKDLLDEERKKSVEEVIKKSDEVKVDLKTIESGIQYLESLSKTFVSTSLVQNINRRETYFGQIQKLMSYENWPPFVKWTLEAVLVISVVITVSLIVPWAQFKDFVMQSKNSELILAELPKSDKKSLTESLGTSEPVGSAAFADETGTDQDVKPITAQEVESQVPEQIPVEPPKKVAATKPPPKVEEPKKVGFVYRGTLVIVNVEVGTTKLKDTIVELGGRKAGEVELGWRRNEGDYYFHFTIPESKLADLEEYFKTLGTIKLSRDPHPRVMPDGIVRMIITTEEPK